MIVITVFQNALGEHGCVHTHTHIVVVVEIPNTVSVYLDLLRCQVLSLHRANGVQPKTHFWEAKEMRC